MRLSALALIGVLFAIPAGSAHAQPNSAADREARSLFQAGEQAFSSARFDRALQYFQQAYELSDRPELLFNIANCHDRLRNSQEAAAAFRLYMERVPNASNMEFARTRAEALEAELASSGNSEPPPPTETTTTTTTTATSSSSSQTTTTDPGETGGGGGGGPSIAGIALTAAGGALVLGGVGSIFWFLDRADTVTQCEAMRCMNRDTLAGERDTAAGVMGALLGVGVAVAAVGVVLIIVDQPGDESASLSCAPGVGGVSCAGRF